MPSYPVVCTFAVVKMASSEYSLVSERSHAYMLRKQGFEVSQIMDILNKQKTKSMTMEQLKRSL